VRSLRSSFLSFIFLFSPDDDRDSRLLFAVVPGEPVCVENLTPLRKLLPYPKGVGVACLLDDP
jgi:hypothetical protein